MNKSAVLRLKLSFPNVSGLALHQWNYQFVETVAGLYDKQFFVQKDLEWMVHFGEGYIEVMWFICDESLQNSLRNVTVFSQTAAKPALNQIPAPMTNISCNQKVPNRVTCYLPIFSYFSPCNEFYSVYVLNAWSEFRLYSNLWGRRIFSFLSFFS